MRRVLTSKNGVLKERTIGPAILHSIGEILPSVDWLATVDDDGKPQYVWGDTGRALEYLGAKR